MQRRRDREREKERGDGQTDGRTALTDHNESMNARARSIVSRVESSSFPYSFHIQRSCVRTPNSVLIVMFRHATFIQEGTKSRYCMVLPFVAKIGSAGYPSSGFYYCHSKKLG